MGEVGSGEWFDALAFNNRLIFCPAAVRSAWILTLINPRNRKRRK